MPKTYVVNNGKGWVILYESEPYPSPFLAREAVFADLKNSSPMHIPLERHNVTDKHYITEDESTLAQDAWECGCIECCWARR